MKGPVMAKRGGVRRLDHSVFIKPNVTTRVHDGLERVHAFAVGLAVFDDVKLTVRAARAVVELVGARTPQIRTPVTNAPQLHSIHSCSLDLKLCPLTVSSITFHCSTFADAQCFV